MADVASYVPGYFSRTVVFGFALPCFVVTNRPLIALRYLPPVDPLLPGVSLTVVRGCDFPCPLVTYRPDFALRLFPPLFLPAISILLLDSVRPLTTGLGCPLNTRP